MDNRSDQTELSILVVDDETNIRKTLAMSLENNGHRVMAVSNVEDAVAAAGERSFDMAFVDLRLGTASGLDLIPRLLAPSPWMKIVVITAYASVDTALDAMKRGAADYLPKPFTPAQVRLVTEKVARLRALEQEVAGLQQLLGQSEPEASLTSTSPAMQRAVNLARQVAQSEATVLIRGESGTGKGVLARAIHRWSGRASKPFAVIACPSLSAELLESELFGHAKGAFTSAVRENPGRIAASEGGTVLLDEVGDLPLGLQPKLLRFMQDREYERVGDNVTRRADVRIIAATNVNLEDAVRNGRFREDLLYRINVFQIDIPPLRQRPDDLVQLAEKMLAFFSRRRPVTGFTPDALAAMRQYSWPGNVRELRNVVERAAILCQGEQVGVEHLPSGFTPKPAAPAVGDLVSLDKLEETHIRRVLAVNKSLEEAATILGIDVATLWRKRKKYGI